MRREPEVLTPSQLNTLARTLLEDSFPAILVEGEISGLSRPASVHLYFYLKDERAQVRCAMFKPKSQWLRFPLRDGLKVLARGRITLYEPRGDFQLVCDSLEDAGEGALRRAFEALKARLQAEGLFDQARKRPLPALPRRIGVLTSPTGAVIRDILSVLRRRFPLVAVELLPVPVQGEGAAAQIRAMLQAADASGRYDVLVLARGGGSLEDLWAFNDEALARAIAACVTPVVAAIGHETDVSLADFAADLRAPTPSAAAELLVPDMQTLARQLATLRQRLNALAHHHLQRAAQRNDRAWLRLHAQRPQLRLASQAQRLSQARQRLDMGVRQRLLGARAELRHLCAVLRGQQPQLQLARHQQRLLQLRRRLETGIQQSLKDSRIRLRHAGAALRAQHPGQLLARLRRRLTELQPRPRRQLERTLQILRQRLDMLGMQPQAWIARRLQHHLLRLEGLARSLSANKVDATLARGYSILLREHGQVVASVHDVQPGERLRARLRDGELRLRVEPTE